MLESKDGLFEALEKIKQQSPALRQAQGTSSLPRGEGGKLALTLPEGSPLLNNLLTLKILKKQAKKLGIALELETKDPKGQNLLSLLNPAAPTSPSSPFNFQEGVDIYTEAGQAVEQKGRKLLNFIKSPWMKKFFLFSAVGLGGLGVVFALLWTVPKATIRLTIRSENLVQSFELTASPSAVTIDAAKRILPAVLVEVEETGEQKTETTGKKDKGTKAEGEVTIYNWTDEDKTFAKETVLTLIRVEGEKLKFLLDEAGEIPAQSMAVSTSAEEITTTRTPGKKTVRVRAEEVGEEYNIANEEELSITGLSTDNFLAQSNETFEGGKKEEVQVVTREDQNGILKKLKDELEKKAREDIKSRTVGDQRLTEEAVSYEILGQTFDKDVDEEAKEVTLTLRLKGSALVYSKAQLDELVSILLSENVPEDFNLSDKGLVTEVSAAKVVEGEDGGKMLKILAKLKASVVSKINEGKIKKDLVGRSLETAQKYLEALPGVSTVEITVFPPLPGPLTKMPRAASRIDLLLEEE